MIVNYLDMIDEHLENIGVERIPRKYIRNLDDLLEKYNDEQFLKHYRIPKIIILDNLLDLLGINYNNNSGLPLLPLLQLLKT